jgi:hypothetical protein
MSERKQGRKFDTVEIKVEDKVYDIEVRIIKGDRSYGTATGFTYLIDIDEPVAFRHTGTDINALIALCAKDMREELAVEWKDVLHVEFSTCPYYRSHHDTDDRDDRMDSCGSTHALKLDWEHKQIGRRDDTPVHRNPNSPSLRTGELEVGKDHVSSGFNVFKEVTKTVVDDTPENREALIYIGDQIDKLQEKLEELFSPKTIQDTLTAVKAKANLFLLVPTTQEKA